MSGSAALGLVLFGFAVIGLVATMRAMGRGARRTWSAAKRALESSRALVARLAQRRANRRANRERELSRLHATTAATLAQCQAMLLEMQSRVTAPAVTFDASKREWA